MPDYIYLLKNRLSLHQRNALEQIRLAAREAGMTVFLVGGAVRDLTSGSPVLDLDVTVQGNALKLKKTLEKAGGKLWGEHEPSRTLFFRFPVGVTVEISSARREEYPKPGKPVYQWDTILEDLRRRDFTANAMALSLNEHSYGLLMDPLNGVADIEARQLRLVSNYGFIEDPARLLRATRLVTRLGWELDERTLTRFQNAKEEKAIEALSAYHKGYELEEIGHEEDGLRVLAAMEAEGWMQYLFPAWTTAAADATALAEMRKLVTQLQMQGVSPDISAASLHFLTAKLSPKDAAALKAMFVRPGFVEEWNNLDSVAKEFNKQLAGKEAATPSATWKLFTSADPQAVLWLGLTTQLPGRPGEIQELLYRMAGGAAEGSPCPAPGTADHPRGPGLRGNDVPAVPGGHRRQTGDRRTTSCLPGTLLTPGSSTAGNGTPYPRFPEIRGGEEQDSVGRSGIRPGAFGVGRRG